MAFNLRISIFSVLRDKQRKQFLSRAFLLIFCVFSAVYSITCFVSDIREGFWGNSTMAEIYFLFFLYSLKHSIKIWHFNVLAALSLFNLCFIILNTGEFYSTLMTWLAIIPIAMMLVTNVRLGVLWLVAIIAFSVGVFFNNSTSLIHNGVVRKLTSWDLQVSIGYYILIFSICFLFKEVLLMSYQVMKTKNQKLITTRQKLMLAQQHKDQFVSNINHELRTPLNGILGVSTILKNNLTDPENIKLLANLTTSAEHLLTLVNDILDLSKINNGNFELVNMPFNIKEVIQSAYSMNECKAIEKLIRFPITF